MTTSPTTAIMDCAPDVAGRFAVNGLNECPRCAHKAAIHLRTLPRPAQAHRVDE